MDYMNYIIFDFDGSEVVFIFTESFGHHNIADKLKLINKILGAGVINLTDKGVKCYGESTSLHVSSRHDIDAALINKALGYESEEDLPMIDPELKDKILGTVTDLVSSFLYYDRKEDEDLARGSIESAIKHNVITIDDIINKFSETLRNSLKAEV
jgi:hypothetical protein